MAESPIDQLLRAVDALDLGAAMALMAPDCKLLTVDGRRAAGTAAVRELLTAFLSTLRATKHRVTAQWQQDDVWIAEVQADYELQDGAMLSALPRAFVLRDGSKGFVELHAYGAHEQPLDEHRTGEPGLRVGGRWVPSL